VKQAQVQQTGAAFCIIDFQRMLEYQYFNGRFGWRNPLANARPLRAQALRAGKASGMGLHGLICLYAIVISMTVLHHITRMRDSTCSRAC
jgi:hypothetical protein